MSDARLGHGDEPQWRDPMRYSASFADDERGATRHWFLSLNDVVVRYSTHRILHEPIDVARRHHLATRYLWERVALERPVYYERARALGWTP